MAIQLVPSEIAFFVIQAHVHFLCLIIYIPAYLYFDCSVVSCFCHCCCCSLYSNTCHFHFTMTQNVVPRIGHKPCCKLSCFFVTWGINFPNNVYSMLTTKTLNGFLTQIIFNNVLTNFIILIDTQRSAAAGPFFPCQIWHQIVVHVIIQCHAKQFSFCCSQSVPLVQSVSVPFVVRPFSAISPIGQRT